MAAIGPRWASDIVGHSRQTIEAYSSLLRETPRPVVQTARELAYGPDPRQRLDVYHSSEAFGQPIVIFVHGGAFIRGQKDVTAEVYGNVPRYFAEHGLVGINVEYRLAPEFAFPSGAHDVEAAVRWARAHAGAYGGDPRRIFLMGHSAGGTHAASYVFDASVRLAGSPDVAGLVLVSARLRADVLPDNPNASGVRAYFGDDPALYESRSPLAHAAESDLPVFIAIAEFENPYLDVYGAELFYRLSVARRRSPPFMRLVAHNHTSVVAHFGAGHEVLGPAILDFIAKEVSRR